MIEKENLSMSTRWIQLQFKILFHRARIKDFFSHGSLSNLPTKSAEPHLLVLHFLYLIYFLHPLLLQALQVQESGKPQNATGYHEEKWFEWHYKEASWRPKTNYIQGVINWLSKPRVKPLPKAFMLGGALMIWTDDNANVFK